MPFNSSAESSRAAPGRGRPKQPTLHCHCALSWPFSSSEISSPAPAQQSALPYTQPPCGYGAGGWLRGAQEPEERGSRRLRAALLPKRGMLILLCAPSVSSHRRQAHTQRYAAIPSTRLCHRTPSCICLCRCYYRITTHHFTQALQPSSACVTL